MSSTKKTAHIAGALYVLLAIVAPFGMMYMPSVLFVRGDAAATAANIASSESMFRLGIVTSMLTEIVFITLGVVLYRLFRNVGRLQAQLMLAVVLVSAATGFLNRLNYLAVLIVLSGADFLSVFTKPQLDALVLFFVRLHGHGLEMISLFWGVWLFPFGYLVYRSRFIPKVFGVLLVINGVGYAASSIVSVLSPETSALVDQITLPAKFAGEFPIMFWLLITRKGAKTTAAEGAAPARLVESAG